MMKEAVNSVSVNMSVVHCCPAGVLNRFDQHCSVSGGSDRLRLR